MIPPKYWLVPPGKPLYYASLCGFYDVAKHFVVSHPERVNVRGGLMGNPLGAALYGKHLQVAELLYELGADFGGRDGVKWTLLHWASRVTGRASSYHALAAQSW